MRTFAIAGGWRIVGRCRMSADGADRRAPAGAPRAAGHRAPGGQPARSRCWSWPSSSALSLALRTQAIHARFWIDEGLSVGIASHPLADIPGVLRQDGSPPLYYLLLSVWMSVFGNGEADTHALSLAFAILTVPAAWLGAARALRRRAALDRGGCWRRSTRS